MLDAGNLSIFLLATIMLNITPGPDMLYVATRSISQGRMAGIVSSLGIAAGCLVHTILAAFGLSALLTYSSMAFEVVKYAGAAYLIYLGVKMLIDKTPQNELSALPRSSLQKLFQQGAVTNMLNPKVGIFFLAFLPQFASPSSDTFTLQVVFLGLLFNTSGTIVNILVAVIFGFAGNFIQSNKRFWTFQRYLCASVFIGLGIRLGLTKR